MPTATAAVEAATVHGLTARELDHFHQRGWVKSRLFDAGLMARLAAETEGLHEALHLRPREDVHVSWEELPAGRPPRIRQLMHSEKVSPLIDYISRSSEMLAVMRQLIGPDLYLFHSKGMMKAANDGTFTPWHQDWGYWQYGSKEPTHINGMLAIDAADAANGAIRFVDGSHRRGAIDHTRFPEAKSFGIGLSTDLGAYPDATLVEMEPGEVIFFGPLVIHGSGPNTSPRDRRANTFAYDRAGNQKNGPLPSASWRLGAPELPPPAKPAPATATASAA